MRGRLARVRLLRGGERLLLGGGNLLLLLEVEGQALSRGLPVRWIWTWVVYRERGEKRN